MKSSAIFETKNILRRIVALILLTYWTYYLLTHREKKNEKQKHEQKKDKKIYLAELQVLSSSS